MTGGTGMYIHSYQIHNVLNAYRKQLCQNPSTGGPRQPAETKTDDRINISPESQKPKIVDDISTQIIDRITKFSPRSKFDQVLADRLSQFQDAHAPHPDRNKASAIDFTYTEIDELNRKTTNTLKVHKFNPFNHAIEPQSADPMSMDQPSEIVPALDSDDKNDQQKG
jgi:hypothetical protein